MGVLDVLYEKYHGKDLNDIPARQVNEEIREKLEHMEDGEIGTCDDARKFIELVSDYRRYAAGLMCFVGDGFMGMVQKMLGVGTNGVYFGKNRYIFELIQNVDDCKYPVKGDRSLDIRFDFEKNTINLSYTETGFETKDVFAITGIAEKSKNLSDDNIQIGEKGIGFKSVFGVADRVVIRSGLFSFSLKNDNVMAPEPLYDDGFDGVTGTELTIHLFDSVSAEDTFRDLVRTYNSENAIFNDNPILFLNNLTRLGFSGGGNTLEFTVTRGKAVKSSRELYIEDGVCLTARCQGASVKNFEKRIICRRFRKDVCYTRTDCESRYGEDTSLGKNGCREMPVYVIVPDPEYVSGVRGGTLYSFMPTGNRLNIPMAVHVPFELTSSREGVDPQIAHGGETNPWYAKSLGAMQTTLDETYEELADMVGEDIVHYLPNKSRSSFNGGLFENTHAYDRDRILGLSIFKTADGKRNGNEIVCMGSEHGMNQELSRRAFGLLRPEGRSLFVCPDGCRPEDYGFDVISGIKEKILRKAFEDPASTRDAVAFLCEFDEDDLRGLDADMAAEFTLDQIVSLASCEKIRNDLLNEVSRQKLKKAKQDGQVALAKFRAGSGIGTEDVRMCIPDFAVEKIASEAVEAYLWATNYRCVLFRGDEPSFIAMGNAVALSVGEDGDAGDSFAAFCLFFDKHSRFAINREIDRELNSAKREEGNESISDYEYLQILNTRQQRVKDLLDTSYNKYISLIVMSGKDPYRFIGELLQNADDCNYPEGEDVVPTFSIAIGGRRITTECNETGFTRANVRAITEMGESTKARLLSDDSDSIGEKGVGFKTVFSTAESVRIESGDFCFELTREEPTIPRPSKINRRAGTRMDFSLSEPFPADYLSEGTVLKLVLCLRKLRRVRLGEFDVRIEDEAIGNSKRGGERNIYINGKRYPFRKMSLSFAVRGKRALEERKKSRADADGEQRVTCYIFYGETKRKPGEKNGDIGTGPTETYLYCGLPTSVKTYNHMCIDAPFELTTSRDEVVNNRWNDEVLNHVYAAIEDVILASRNNFERTAGFLGISPMNGDPDKSEYETHIFSDESLNDLGWPEKLAEIKFLPTFVAGEFVSPSEVGRNGCKWYPAVVDYLLESGEKPKFVIPSRTLHLPRVRKSLLNALGCEMENTQSVVDAISPFIGDYITDDKFREKLYRYMSANPSSIYKNLRVFPVYDKSGESTEYVAWSDRIFVYDVKKSTDAYYVLNEDVLSKKDCESALSRMQAVIINRLDVYTETGLYSENLCDKMRSLPLADAYEYVMSELESGNLGKRDVSSAMNKLKMSEKLPLKNALGEIVSYPLFINTMGADYFARSDAIRAMTVDQGCVELARYAGAKDLSDIHYSDFHDPCDLKADDIEALQDEYFIYRIDIIYGHIKDGHISKELIEKYSLQNYLDIGADTDGDDDLVGMIGWFPSDPISTAVNFERRMDEKIKGRKELEEIREKRWVIRYKNGDLYDPVNENENRNETLERYSFDDHTVSGRKVCVCQRCKKLRMENHIETDNIQSEPVYEWCDMHISLCLECSKTFKKMRSIESERNAFIDRLLRANCTQEEPIEIPDGTGESIGFTQTHLAEIQRILKWERTEGKRERTRREEQDDS